ncbi:MAG: hypothetical protein ACK4WK_06120, partial [Anaerolineae bacterium]
PAEARRALGIQEGDVFSLLWLDDILIATRRRLVTPDVARAIEALMQQKGLTLEDLLEGVEEQRQTYVRERYSLD